MSLNNIKSDFPLLVNDTDLVYLDTAATSQKPKSVIQAISEYYENYNANAHRGVYKLGAKASICFEKARQSISDFIGAKSDQEIVFTRGTTEGINIVAHGYLKPKLNQGDKIIVGGVEHHANVVPWQMVAQERGASIDYIPVSDEGVINLDQVEKLITNKTKLIAIAHVSNVLGTVNPVSEIINLAKKYSIPVLIDGAQAVGHKKIKVSELGSDFYVFSGHKMYGPMGIGVLHVKEHLISQINPLLTGGGMIEDVLDETSTFLESQQRLEAGTQSIADAYGLMAAVNYINSIGLDSIIEHEKSLITYAESKLLKVEKLNLIGPKTNRQAPIFSFLIEGIHPHDMATVFDDRNVAVRAGHHCSQHAMRRFNINATVRASLGIYNTYQDVDALIEAIDYAKKLFIR